MTPELQRALKRHTQWFGSYKKSGELVKVQVWLVVNRGGIEFLTGKNSYKVKRLRRNPKAICYVGSKNGPEVVGTAQIISEKAELARLRKENKELRLEREILKKAAAFFAKENG